MTDKADALDNIGTIFGAMSGYMSTYAPGYAKYYGALSTGFSAFSDKVDEDGFTSRDFAELIGATAAGTLTGTIAVKIAAGALGTLAGTAAAPLLAGAIAATGLGILGGIAGGYAYDGISEAMNELFDNPPVCPLILDLDQDGVIELTALSNSNTSFFDLDADGFAEQTGWVSPEDGLLAIDRNGDGIINDINELFGNMTTDGFVELAALIEKAANDNVALTYIAI